ncbi:DUF3710 domain-containing protein [Streptomyces sp. NPDC056352]|uniref:DUF3710 domain-containing protein n=1 Tax=Streptomyces sp. NPDC056352 TaxID=3345791 RepID=UPI0035E1915D
MPEREGGNVSKDGGDAKDRTGEILKKFAENGTVTPDFLTEVESEGWGRLAPPRIILAAIQIVLRSRWKDGLSSIEQVSPRSVPLLSQQDSLTMTEALLGDVSAVSEAQPKELLSLLNLIGFLAALLKEESTSDEDVKHLLHAAEEICRDSLHHDVLRRGIESGPWDISEVDVSNLSLIDLGGLRVPTSLGMEVRPIEAGGAMVAVTLVKDGTALQLQTFHAASKILWNSTRVEMMNKMRAQGGTVKEWAGRAGLEIRASVPVVMESGQSAVKNVRVLGCDGPGWMLRGIVSGIGADPQSADEWAYDIFSGTVVIGTHPLKPVIKPTR